MSSFNQYSDSVLFDLFSDWYKDVNGFRPSRWRREDIIAWMEGEIAPEVQAQRRAQWQAEEEMINQAIEHQERLDREWAEEQAELAASQVEKYYYDMEMSLGI